MGDRVGIARNVTGVDAVLNDRNQLTAVRSGDGGDDVTIGSVTATTTVAVLEI